MSDDPNYPVIELEAKLEESKDTVIKLQRVIIQNLEKEVAYLRGLIKVESGTNETDVGSNMIAPSDPPKPRVRTTSEVSVMLERRSYNSANAVKSAEEVTNVGQNS